LQSVEHGLIDAGWHLHANPTVDARGLSWLPLPRCVTPSAFSPEAIASTAY
jgi:hypothetical protein